MAAIKLKITKTPDEYLEARRLADADIAENPSSDAGIGQALAYGIGFGFIMIGWIVTDGDSRSFPFLLLGMFLGVIVASLWWSMKQKNIEHERLFLDYQLCVIIDDLKSKISDLEYEIKHPEPEDYDENYD